jgi:phytoene/squalene synthetase
MHLYNQASFECSKLITLKYSTSFSRGIKAFDKRFRAPIYSIYGFVRYADEIVDTFHEHDKQKLISNFKRDAFEAIEQKISLNPILQSFQQVVNQYHIELSLIRAFFASMEMDLEKKTYNQEEYQTYVYGSSEVIGSMCLCVFCEGDTELYNRLQPMARSLGAAFQKINFLRDIKADSEERGRVYFPGVDLNCFTEENKHQIIADIKKDLFNGLAGIKQLPSGCRKGVYLAFLYYGELLKKITVTPASALLQKRIRVSNPHKTAIYLNSLILQNFL